MTMFLYGFLFALAAVSITMLFALTSPEPIEPPAPEPGEALIFGPEPTPDPLPESTPEPLPEQPDPFRFVGDFVIEHVPQYDKPYGVWHLGNILNDGDGFYCATLLDAMRLAVALGNYRDDERRGVAGQEGKACL